MDTVSIQLMLQMEKKKINDHWKIANISLSSPAKADKNAVTLINCSSFTKV